MSPHPAARRSGSRLCRPCPSRMSACLSALYSLDFPQTSAMCYGRCVAMTIGRTIVLGPTVGWNDAGAVVMPVTMASQIARSLDVGECAVYAQYARTGICESGRRTAWSSRFGVGWHGIAWVSRSALCRLRAVQ